MELEVHGTSELPLTGEEHNTIRVRSVRVLSRYTELERGLGITSSAEKFIYAVLSGSVCGRN